MSVGLIDLKKSIGHKVREKLTKESENLQQIRRSFFKESC